MFRTNSSYDRWWEARKALGNTIQLCRTLAAQTSPMLRDDDCCRELISAIMGFALALKANLREEKLRKEELGPLLVWEEIRQFNDSPNASLMAINRLFYIIAHSLPQHEHSGHSLGAVVFNQANEDLQALIQEVSVCERIRDTPMVFSYVATLRTFLMLFLFSLPMVMIGEYGWLATPGVSLIAYLFLNIEQMALEIEQPFGDDPNDLPMEGYLLELEKEMISMLPGEVGHIRNPNRMNSPTKDHELSSVASDGSASPSPRPTAAINARGDVVPGGNQRQQGEADAEAEARRVGEEAALMAC